MEPSHSTHIQREVDHFLIVAWDFKSLRAREWDDDKTPTNFSEEIDVAPKISIDSRAPFRKLGQGFLWMFFPTIEQAGALSSL